MTKSAANKEFNVSPLLKDFSTRLFNRITSDNSNNNNTIVSSFSVYMALLMAANGSSGTTLTEFEKLLAIDSASSDVTSVNQSVMELTEKLKDGIVHLANALFISDQFTVKDKFITTVSETFDSESQIVDFSKSREATNLINKWVKDQTNGKITDLIPKNVIDQMIRLVLVNAIHFKQDWKIQFPKKNTTVLNFDQDENTSHQVQTMKLTGKSFLYGENERARWIHLPYKNNCSMVLVLPEERFGLSKIASDVLSGTIPVVTDVDTQKISLLQLPKFKFDFTVELSQILKDLGLQEAFTLSADFTNITDANDINISGIFHKAFIQVDEKGTEAAAATAVLSRTKSKRSKISEYEFKCDQPFIFMIVYESIVLFEGQVYQPIQ